MTGADAVARDDRDDALTFYRRVLSHGTGRDALTFFKRMLPHGMRRGAFAFFQPFSVWFAPIRGFFHLFNGFAIPNSQFLLAKNEISG